MEYLFIRYKLYLVNYYFQTFTLLFCFESHRRELKAEFFPFCSLASDHEEQKGIKKKEPLAASAGRGSLVKKFIWTGVE